MNKIEFSPHDFVIKQITTKDNTKLDIVELRGGLKYNPEFVNEMRQSGVKDYVAWDASGNEVEL